MFARALIAFLALPGVVAFAVPIVWLWLSDHASLTQPLGLVPLAAGLVGLLWCVRDFYVAGRGTLAPWSPPRRLVTVGLYKFSRNPMYIAVLLILCGWALAYQSGWLWIYAVIVAIAFHLRVVFYEEPWLARTHRREWNEYRAGVRRWFGRRSA